MRAGVVFICGLLIQLGNAQLDPYPCKQNETFNTCTSRCGDGCRTLFVQTFCILSCGPPACTCQSNYYRSPLTGLCVLASDCPTTSQYDYENDRPITCGPNETLQVSNSCSESCNAPFLQCLANSPNQPPGCFCAPGFCRNDQGVCINSNSCGQNQTIYVPYDPCKGAPIVVLVPDSNQLSCQL